MNAKRTSKTDAPGPIPSDADIMKRIRRLKGLPEDMPSDSEPEKRIRQLNDTPSDVELKKRITQLGAGVPKHRPSDRIAAKPQSPTTGVSLKAAVQETLNDVQKSIPQESTGGLFEKIKNAIQEKIKLLAGNHFGKKFSSEATGKKLSGKLMLRIGNPFKKGSSMERSLQSFSENLEKAQKLRREISQGRKRLLEISKRTLPGRPNRLEVKRNVRQQPPKPRSQQNDPSPPKPRL